MKSCTLACFCAIGFAVGFTAHGTERRTITFDYVVEQARRLAESGYQAPDEGLPAALRDLSYDQYRGIRFKPEEALWRKDGLPWALELFHRGYLFKAPVQINEFNETHVQQLRFVANWYNYGPESGIEAGAWFPSHLDYAGVRLKYPLNDPRIFDEIASFIGASYFRMLGQKQIYGISARGLAINTLAQEEFPRFTRFWLQKPQLHDESLLIYALLDSASATGAYQFRITPGKDLRAEIKTTVFLRKEVEQLGFAPFSSMFFFGENTVQKPADYRPEVHDSDGLLLAHSGGAYLWRPLTNEHRTKSTAFPVVDLEGFGLMQRDRDFGSYEDLEAFYERRPSVWVEPIGEWPAGSVRLVELLSRNEIMDNIVAYWEPDPHPAVGEPFTLEYVLHWTLERSVPLGKVVATRAGRSVNEPNEATIVVDFARFPEDLLPEKGALLPVITVAKGATLVHHSLSRNPHIDGWRLALQLQSDSSEEAPKEGVLLEAHLEADNRTVTETWHYLWIPPES